MKPFDKPIYVTRPFMADLDEFVPKLEEIWENQWLTNKGPQSITLESELCKYLKVSGLSLFNNGTIGLMTACKALDLTGEVITTPFTFPATSNILAWLNLTPVFCDIEENTAIIDPAKIENLITPDTSAILGVHIFGNPCDVYKIQEIADKHNLKVVYDAAHAFGTEINGQGIGNFGDITMFSFHATKIFHTAEGGALTFKNTDLKSKIDLLRNFGIKNEEKVLLPGINGKMNEIQAALGLVNLKNIEQQLEKRMELFGIYKQNLEGIEGIKFFETPENVTGNFQYMIIRIDKEKFGLSRNDVYEKFKHYNIYTRKYFYPLCSNYSFFSSLPSANSKNLPVANKLAEEVLCLPMYDSLDPSEVEQICEIFRSFNECYAKN